jgi:tyrosyl-tRNA synthetase
VYKLAALVTTAHAQHAGAEVVKQSAAPKLSNLLYPLLQALDEEYLGCDIQFGGVDQRKIFMFAREWLPRIGYKKRAYVMNPLIPGLGKSGKMSSSEKLSKVDLHDAPEVIRDKFLKAYSVDGQPAGNGMLALLRHVLFRYLESVKRPFVCAGRNFATYAELEDAFRDGSLVSLPLKEATAELLSEFLAPLRDFYAANRGLYDAAYPASSESHAEAAAAASAAGGGLVGVRLESGRVVSIEPHPSSAKHRVVKLAASENRTLVAVPTEDAPQLTVGEHLVFVANGVEQNVKEVIANAHLLTSASFDKAKGLRTVCYLVALPGFVGPVVFGPADTPSDTPLSLSAVGKSLKSLEVKDGMLAFKGFLAEPRVTVAVDNQIKI